MNYKFIEPNKPIKSGVGTFDIIDDSYIVESKLDGWRISAYKDQNILKTVSKKNKTIELNPDLKNVLFKAIPEGCCIDCEWVNISRIKAINKELNCKLALVNFLSIIDIIYHDHVYLSNIDYADRRLKKLDLAIDTLQISDLLDLSKLDNGIFYPPNCLGCNSQEFFSSQNNLNISEGVVIKKLSGNIKSTWIKVKYR